MTFQTDTEQLICNDHDASIPSSKSSCSSSDNSPEPTEPSTAPLCFADGYEISMVKSAEECGMNSTSLFGRESSAGSKQGMTLETRTPQVEKPEDSSAHSTLSQPSVEAGAISSPSESWTLPDWLYNPDTSNKCTSPGNSKVNGEDVGSTTIVISEAELNTEESSSRILQIPGVTSSGTTNDDAESILSGGYFNPEDFSTSIWIKALDGPSFGFAMVALATAIVHPLLFVCGAVTAFGMLHAAGAGYDCCVRGDESTTSNFGETTVPSSFFDGNSDNINNTNGGNKGFGIVDVAYDDEQHDKENVHPDEDVTGELEDPNNTTFGSHSTIQQSGSAGVSKSVLEQQLQPNNVPAATENKLQKTKAKSSLQKTPGKKLSKSRVRTRMEVTPDDMKRHYPALKTKVVQDVEFPGLSAYEFFEVFFDDDAPFNFRELQKKRGDVDIEYQLWKPLDETESSDQKSVSMHPIARVPLKELNCNYRVFEGRVCTYKAKTNSYIGPPYAFTTKTQRALLVSKKLAIIENHTLLKDVPFADRFYVMDRWVITAEKINDRYVSKLSASTEVIFTSRCNFESQIQSKSSSAIAELIIAWCTFAKEALKLTEQAKLNRLRRQLHDEEDESSLHDFLEMEDANDAQPCASSHLDNENVSGVAAPQHEFAPPLQCVEIEFGKEVIVEVKDNITLSHRSKRNRRRKVKESPTALIPSIIPRTLSITSIDNNTKHSIVVVSPSESQTRTSITEAEASLTSATSTTKKTKRRFQRKLSRLLSK